MKLITSRFKHPRCPFCHDKVRADEVKLACNACMAWHHQACWTEGGDACASCGRTSTGKTAGAGEKVTDDSETAVKSFTDWIGLTVGFALMFGAPCMGLGWGVDLVRDEFYRFTRIGFYGGMALTLLCSAIAMWEWLFTDHEDKRSVFEDTPDPDSGEAPDSLKS